MINNELFKFSVLPVQHIKTEYQNKKNVMTDNVSDEEVAG